MRIHRIKTTEVLFYTVPPWSFLCLLELKNQFTVDYIYLYADEEAVKRLGKPYEKVGDGFRVTLRDTVEATELIVKYPEVFVDYEIVKGKMDDVFLNATGKNLGGENA